MTRTQRLEAYLRECKRAYYTGVVTDEEYGRYELTEELTGHHHHLFCSSCGRTSDVTLVATGITVPRAFLGCGTFGGIGGVRDLVGRGLDRKAAFAAPLSSVATTS